MDTPVVKVQCPECGAKQAQTMKSIVQPDSNNIHACTKCQSPMPSGETALLLTMMRDTRRTAKWVALWVWLLRSARPPSKSLFC